MARSSSQSITNNAGRDDWKVISLVGVAHASSHFFQLVIPSMYVALAAAFSLDFARLGLLMSVFYVVSGLGQAASGFVVDRLGGHRVLWFGLGCFVLSAVTMGSATGYSMLMLGAILGGLGNSVFHPADFSILNLRVSTERLGHAFSVHGLTGSLGWAAAPMFVAGLTVLVNWRVAAFGVAVLVGLILLATIVGRHLLHDRQVDEALAGSETTQTKRPAQAMTIAETLRVLLASPALWGAFLFFAMTSVSLSAIQNYTMPILGQLYQMSEVLGSSALSSYMLASAAGMLAGGFVAGATPNSERVVAMAYSAGGVILVALALGIMPAPLAFAGVAAAGFCTGIAGPSRDMLIRRVTPKGAMGSVYGLVYSGMDTGAALAPLLFGLMMDQGWASGPWVGAGIALWTATIIAALIAQQARRTEMRTVSA